MILMNLGDFDLWVRERLLFDETDSLDASLNGIQVGDPSVELTKIGFAVDACMDTFRRSEAEGAQLLFVHHGLFWGPALPLTGVLGERVRFLMKKDLALYAAHLPLDKHAEVGNNARIMDALGIAEPQPFGSYKGKKLGFKGSLPEACGIEEIIVKIFGSWEDRINLLQFGPKEINTVAVISGGGTREVSQAIDEGIDLYITGDSSHNIYHEAREAGINVVFAGHYLTEVFGVKAMADAVAAELGIETVFIDVPTGY